MGASSLNYLVVYRGTSQVFGTASKAIALKTAPPAGVPLEDKMVYFIANEPDNERMVWYRIPDDEVQSAEIEVKKTKKEKVKDEDES